MRMRVKATPHTFSLNEIHTQAGGEGEGGGGGPTKNLVHCTLQKAEKTQTDHFSTFMPGTEHNRGKENNNYRQT